MGFEPLKPRSKLASVNNFVDCMSKGLEEAKSVLSKAKDEYTLYYNCRHEPAPELQSGDLVWVDATDIATNRPSSVAAAPTDSRLTAGSRAGNKPAGNRLGYGCAVAPTWAASSGTAGSRSY
jgi:hypothetical protein